jgi:hypothetical protein
VCIFAVADPVNFGADMPTSAVITFPRPRSRSAADSTGASGAASCAGAAVVMAAKRESVEKPADAGARAGAAGAWSSSSSLLVPKMSAMRDDEGSTRAVCATQGASGHCGMRDLV